MAVRVLSVASEAYPLVKTGGLGDVAGALPAALAGHGVEMTTLLPGYPAVLRALGARGRRAKQVHRWPSLLGTEARLLEGRLGDHKLLVLDAPELFDRGGGPYSDDAGRDWPDNGRRFAALGRAAADVAREGGFDLLHAHDWQAAMAAAYLRYRAGRRVPGIVTIHNLAFQGRFDAALFAGLGLPPEAYALDGVEYYGGVGFLKAGLACADAVTTVSPTYAAEIAGTEHGMGLDGLVRARGNRVRGIVNGIDPAVWNPATDPALARRYTARTLSARAANTRAVERAFGLEEGRGPLYCVVSRLTWQKGMDVLAECLDALVAGGGRLALLGAGDAGLQAAFAGGAARHPGRVGVRIGYDEDLSHLLQGGADAILVPSRFEPCGLTQLYGLAYGCVPVVARTGGLADTVIDANEAALAAGVATGVQFDAATPDALARALARTGALFAQGRVWTAMQRQGMRADFSWARSGARYAALYAELLAEAA